MCDMYGVYVCVFGMYDVYVCVCGMYSMYVCMYIVCIGFLDGGLGVTCTHGH